MHKDLMKPDHGLNDDAWKTFKAQHSAKSKAKRKAKRRGKQQPQRKAYPGGYYAYIQSKAWAKKREQAFKRYGRKCGVCGRTENLQVHHRHYRTLFNERMEDLGILCGDCHANEHEDKGAMDSMSSEFAAMFR